MIALDTSVIVAILKKEPDAERFARAIIVADGCVMSAMSYIETCLVMVGRGSAEAANDVEALIRRVGIEIVPLDLDAAAEAVSAFIRFGKGRHPAALNMGDCASFALAHSRGLPLLYKGADFAKTGIAPVEA